MQQAPAPYAPAPYAAAPAPSAPMAVTFYANASKMDFSFDNRMGRMYAGFRGAGTIEPVPEGLRIVAKRHRYALNLIAGAIIGFLLAGFFTLAALHAKHDAVDYNREGRGAPAIWFFGTLLGAWITSLFGRLAAPQTLVVSRAEIKSAQVFGTRIHLFRHAGGDVAFIAPTREAHQGFLQWLAASGINVALR